MGRTPWVFEWALRVLPERFRERHRRGVVDLITTYARTSGPWGRRWIWLRAAIDVIAVGVALRLSGRTARRREGVTMGAMMATTMADLRFALRALHRRPGFTAVAVVTLGLGIGANTAIYSVVDAVLLQPLPYAESDRIGILWHEFGDGAQDLPAVHALDARDYRDRSDLIEDLTVAGGREWILGGPDDPELVDVGLVESGFFAFFGVVPLHGRSFTARDDQPGAAPTVMLSHRLWARRFGGDPSIVGRSIEVAGRSMQVVGVLPESFRLRLPAEAFLLRDAEVWAPLRLDPSRQPPRNFTGYTAFARLSDDVTFAQAQQELEVMAAQLRAEHPEHASSGLRARIVPLHGDVVKLVRTRLLFLLAAVGLVLLIACANVTNLVLVRGMGRAREFALRRALGAGQAGLVRLSIGESALLASAGAVLGVGLAGVFVETLSIWGPASVPMLDDVTIDGRVLWFVVGVTLLTSCLVGLVPAIRVAGDASGRTLVVGGRASGSRGQRRLQDGLVVAEVAASLTLLIGTGLLLRTFVALGSVDPGYRLDDVLTTRISLPVESFTNGDERDVVLRQLFDDIRALPAVHNVAAVSQLPLTGSGSLQPYAYDEETASNWESVTADQRFVSAEFFEAVGARLVEGSSFGPSEMAAGNAVVIDDRLAARAFPAGDAIGGRLQVNPDDFPEEIRYARVVGVVEHLRLHDLARPHLTQIWYPLRGAARFSLVVRTEGDPSAVGAHVRTIIERNAPGAPIEDLQSMRALAAAAVAPVRMTVGLMVAFGIVALLLASVGLYGVLAYAVSRRTGEIGVRMALGQRPRSVLREVVLDGAKLVGTALALGLLVAGALGHLMSSLLYGVTAFDPVAYALAIPVLAATAAVACWIPARRATRIDPVEALRDTR